MSNPGVRQSIRLRMAKFTAPEADSQIVGQRMTLAKQLVYQALLLFITFTVIFPILWVASMSVDPRADVLRPTTLNRS